MRIFIKPSPNPGDVRIRKKFLWFPKVIGNVGRWLEIAEWKESYDIYYTGSSWEPREWLDL